ncbi:hypothetical protein ACOMHN_052816 [Nucella lapillus]
MTRSTKAWTLITGKKKAKWPTVHDTAIVPDQYCPAALTYGEDDDHTTTPWPAWSWVQHSSSSQREFFLSFDDFVQGRI